MLHCGDLSPPGFTAYWDQHRFLIGFPIFYGGICQRTSGEEILLRRFVYWDSLLIELETESLSAGSIEQLCTMEFNQYERTFR
mmetsp:Transcript_23989/g.4013  ORF Transcript_23989/g.4013 Transcript_23989/m.4013 type:complete len:83 (+) Transcript_23989:824-1072(+)